MEKTKIDWCDSTWNPVTGCLHGCEYCYARRIASRFGLDFSPKLGDAGMEGACKYDSSEGLDTMLELEKPYIKDRKAQPYPMAFYPTFHRYRLDDYIGKKGRNIFVCSMADLFGDWVPDSWIDEVFAVCEKAPQHNYLFLTKNPKRYGEYGVKAYSIPGVFNLWYGMSVTTENDLGKTWILPEYCHTFISIEPILEDFNIVDGDLRLSDLEWVIIGAETGRRKNKIVPKKKWIDDIMNACVRHGVFVFMKSSLAEIWGEPLIQEFPEGLRRKE